MHHESLLRVCWDKISYSSLEFNVVNFTDVSVIDGQYNDKVEQETKLHFI